jgi:predicted dehydrogenase
MAQHRDLRVVVLGCGSAGEVHAARWSQVSGAVLSAVCDVDIARTTQLGRKLGCEAHTNWRELLKRGDVDIVDICTPNVHHLPMAQAAFRAGAHVLCEMPMGNSPEAARQMIRAAAETERLLMPAACQRFHPPVLFLKELIENDDLGRILMFRARFSGWMPDVERTWYADPQISGGGAELDFAVPSVDLFRMLVGGVESVQAVHRRFRPGLAVDDTVVLTLNGPSESIGIIEASWATPHGTSCVEVFGTAGMCILNYDTAQVLYQTADMPVRQTREVFGPDRFERTICHFADAVRGLQVPEVRGEDALLAMEAVLTGRDC